MSISKNISKYLFRNEKIQYTIYNNDYFTTQYNIPCEVVINELQTYTDYFNFIEKNVPKEKAIIDVGANCGIFAVPMSKLGYAVFCFEPVRQNVELLHMNAKENDCKNMKVIDYALMNESSYKQITIPYCGDNSSFNHDVAISNMRIKSYITEEVRSIKFDEWQDINKIENIGFIKIDVQGFEIEVLRGMESFLMNTKDIFILLEYDAKHTSLAGFDIKEIDSFLAMLGFSKFKELDGDVIYHK